ncbi:mitochondrial folate transporter/carrier-like [Sinocyclocheilus grahami]|uniref:mitochondrial folate transporter/carrier-like n=1 Tax=Sinocyclocheilus grahami TaxID=75366 RepID=UPI0007AD2A6C|nr:PREDICTED: mitochondrial folate transporter/carrier-like [Sinocyclocheilus grahami]
MSATVSRQRHAADSSGSSVPLTASLLRLSKHIRYENLAAGLSGGVISTMVLHPLDLIKIRFAVSDGLKMRPQYDGVVHCMKTIWKLEGIRGLYQGVTPNIWGAGASWGLYFLFYNAIKAYTQEGRQTELSAGEHLVSAAEAGQFEKEPPGFVPGLVGTSHAALQFMTYEGLKREQNKYKKMPSESLLSPLEYITMAAISKIFAVAVTYPYQVVRARLQDQHNNYSGIVDVIQRTWSNEGIEGFYKGMVPNLVRVIPACCITFLVFENVSRLLLGEYH